MEHRLAATGCSVVVHVFEVCLCCVFRLCVEKQYPRGLRMFMQCLWEWKAHSKEVREAQGKDNRCLSRS